MSDTATLEFVAATLSEFQSSLEDHLQRAVDLINEAEEVDRLLRADESLAGDLPGIELLRSGKVNIDVLKARHAELHASIVARTRKLHEATQQLQDSVRLEQELLGQIQFQLEEVKQGRRLFRH